MATVHMETRRRTAVFGLLMLSLFTATADTQIIATAIPTIVGELGEVEHYSWIPSSYILSQCAVMPLYGKLGDLFGRKYVIIGALAIFTLGSLACAASWSVGSLIGARVFQGLGTGGILVSAYAVSADLFGRADRARFQSYLSFVFVLGAFVAPPLGGFLTEAFGWRSVFFVTMPIGATAILGFALLLPRRPSTGRPRIDYAGAVTVMTVIVSFVLWLDSATLFGGFASTSSLGLAALAALGITMFIGIERRATEPVIPLELFRGREFPLLCLATMGNGAVAVGLVNHHAYFLQMTTGLSPAEAGFFFIALTVGVTCGALLSGRLMSRGRSHVFPLRVSLAISCVALAGFAMLPAAAPIPLLVGILYVQGFSTGLGMNAPILGAQISVDQSRVGAATGTITLVRMAGAAMANSLFGAIFIAALLHYASGTIQDITTLTPAALRAMDAATRGHVLDQFSNAFSILYVAAALVAAIGLLAALLLRDGSRRPASSSTPTPTPPP